jgi:hypothetical protein
LPGAVDSAVVRTPMERSVSGSGKHRMHSRAIRPAAGAGDIVEIAVNIFGSARVSVLGCLPVLLLLNGCGDAGPPCDSAEVRSSVVRLVADNRDNSLVKFAVENSNSIAEMLSHANAEAEKSAIRDKAKQAAAYALDDNIIVNSSSARTATCTGVIGVSVGDTSAQKEVEFKVEQQADGKISVSVKPFLF